MIHEVFINLKNNNKFFIKFTSLFTLLFALVSIFTYMAFSYFHSLDDQIAKFKASNYYELISLDLNKANEVFAPYEHERFNDLINAEIKVNDSSYKLPQSNFHVLEINRSPTSHIPQNVVDTYKAYQKEICLYGTLPSSSNEICLSYETFSNIRNTNSIQISPSSIIGKTISICSKVSLTDIKVVGILNYEPCDLFERNNLIFQIDRLSELKTITKKSVNRIYIRKFEDIASTNKRIKELKLESFIQYGGTQYGVYLELVAFGDIASTIFVLIGLPLIATLLFVCLFSLRNFYQNQSKLFTEMLLTGYTPIKLIQFITLELFLCTFASFLFSLIIGVASLSLTKFIFSSILVHLPVSVIPVLFASISLLTLLVVFIGMSLLLIRRSIKRPDIYSLTK